MRLVSLGPDPSSRHGGTLDTLPNLLMMIIQRKGKIDKRQQPRGNHSIKSDDQGMNFAAGFVRLPLRNPPSFSINKETGGRPTSNGLP